VIMGLALCRGRALPAAALMVSVPLLCSVPPNSSCHRDALPLSLAGSSDARNLAYAAAVLRVSAGQHQKQGLCDMHKNELRVCCTTRATPVAGRRGWRY
jgi:hypothetical protein